MTNQTAQKKQLPAFLVLTIICLVAALALAVTNAITAGPINEHKMAAQREAFGAVMIAEEYIELPIPEDSGLTSLVEAKAHGETVGYCAVASAQGYAGPVAVTLGIGTDGVITGAKIGDNSFVETAGFGSRWLADNKAEEFKGINIAEGGAVEALSGATVTSNAVLNAANKVVSAVNLQLGNADAPAIEFGVVEKPAAAIPENALVAYGAGFAGQDVGVIASLNADGTLATITADMSKQAPPICDLCDAAWLSQFLGKAGPFTAGENVDVVAGATYTSNGVIEAVNKLLAGEGVPYEAEAPAVETSANVDPNALTAYAPGFAGKDVGVIVTLTEDGAIATLTTDMSQQVPPICDLCDAAWLSQFVGRKGPFTDVDVVAGATFTSQGVIDAVNSLFTGEASAAVEGNVVEGTAQGFQSDVKVTVTLDENNAIAALTIDSAAETAGFGTRCAEDAAFIEQFIGKTAPFAIGENIDALAGATVTSQAVVDAVNSVFPTQNMSLTPAGETFEGAAQGFQSEVKVQVTADNGVITALTILSGDETPGFGTRCAEDAAYIEQFIGKTAPFAIGENIDALAGATVTSQAVVDAVNSVFPTQDMSMEAAAPVEETEAAASYEGAAEGFESLVKAVVTVDENGAITSVKLDTAWETENIGTRVGENEAFLAQFIGQTAPVTADVVSGATWTSNAAIAAVNAALESVAPANTFVTATAPGFLGEDVTVTVELDAQENIVSITLDLSQQKLPFAGLVDDEAFLGQFIGKQGMFTEADTVTGATATSQAVIDAINTVYAPVLTTKTAAAPGFLGEDVGVTLVVDEDGVIVEMTLDLSQQKLPFAGLVNDEAFLAQFIGQAGPFEAIDAVTGATATSNAVVEAVNAALTAE